MIQWKYISTFFVFNHGLVCNCKEYWVSERVGEWKPSITYIFWIVPNPSCTTLLFFLDTKMQGFYTCNGTSIENRKNIENIKLYYNITTLTTFPTMSTTTTITMFVYDN